MDLSLETLAEHLQRALCMAQSMLDNVNEPRHWLLGMEALSRPVEDPRARTNIPRYMTYFLDPEIFFVTCLWECLKSEWHYDVKEVPGLKNFQVISGVAVAGLLRALTGS